MTTNWFDIEPRDATKIVLPRDDIIGPLNELGEPCPWPWEPQQLVTASFGQYHCGYCNGMVMAGIPHLDYRDDPDIIAENQGKPGDARPLPGREGDL